MRTTLISITVALAACGDDGATTMPDAAAPRPDAGSLYCPDPPPDPLRAGTHVVYINTEGVTLTKGACSDSKTGCTDLIKDATATVPQFLPATSGREDFIAEVLRLTRVRLAPFSIELVTERPTSGDYHMIVIGGDPATLVGTPNILSLTPAACTPQPNLVDLIFDRHFSGGASLYASSILSDLGAMYGLLLTDTPGDCMCRINGCDFAGVCTFSPLVAIAPGVPTCGRPPLQNEQTWLKDVVGCR